MRERTKGTRKICCMNVGSWSNLYFLVLALEVVLEVVLLVVLVLVVFVFQFQLQLSLSFRWSPLVTGGRRIIGGLGRDVIHDFCISVLFYAILS